MYKALETADKKEMTLPRPSGPGFSTEEAEAAHRMEMWGTSFSDSGPDFCEFRLFDATGTRTNTRIVPGY